MGGYVICIGQVLLLISLYMVLRILKILEWQGFIEDGFSNIFRVRVCSRVLYQYLEDVQ